MKGYKALLTECELHNHKEMLRLQQSKSAYDRLCKKLQRIDEKVGQNMKNLRNQLDEVEQNCTMLVENIQREVNIFINLDNVYRCGCGFAANHDEKYLAHLKEYHNSLNYVEGSSHFATLYCNLLKFNQKLSSKLRTLPSKRDEEKHSQTEPRNTKLKQRSSKRNLSKEQEIKTKINLNKSVPNKEIAQTLFFCGQCSKSINNFRDYSFHFRVAHDDIIHPSSSHIIIRRGKNLEPMAIQEQQNCRKRFHCHCNSTNNFTRAQFIAHVFKWHKGIAPRK